MTKLKCPNCGEDDKGFLEFVAVQYVDNEDHPKRLFASTMANQSGLGLLCVVEGCGMFGPVSNFQVDPETGDCAGRMPDDPF